MFPRMKKIKFLLMALVVTLVATVPAQARFRIGPRLGTEVNSMRFDKSLFDNENRAGFTGGLMMEFTVPIVNLGFDLSVMYVHRVSNSVANAKDNVSDEIKDMLSDKRFRSRDYVEIPLNFKYKLALPLIQKVVIPYVVTGPRFSILSSKKAINEAYNNKALDVAWNFGVGLELFSHLQVGASYGLGLNKSVEVIGVNAAPIDGKNNYWTVTAAWLF